MMRKRRILVLQTMAQASFTCHLWQRLTSDPLGKSEAILQLKVCRFWGNFPRITSWIFPYLREKDKMACYFHMTEAEPWFRETAHTCQACEPRAWASIPCSVAFSFLNVYYAWLRGGPATLTQRASSSRSRRPLWNSAHFLLFDLTC